MVYFFLTRIFLIMKNTSYTLRRFNTKKTIITVVTLPPSVLAVLSAEELSALRTVVSAGESCSAEITVRWGAGRKLLNAYGPTENTVCATVAECAKSDHRPPIGRPMANVEAYVLDAQLQPSPIGVPGELHIGGVGLARGYLNRPGLTAAKFIPNPFNGDPGARLYRTGDRVRHMPDGNIEYIGRVDNQVKIRGARIELGEIESQLLECDEIKEAVVMARKNKNGDVYLCGYIVSDKEFESSELEEHLGKKLPGYMIPNYFVFLDKLPLGPNGKVDRKQLKEPETISEGDYTLPRNEAEPP